MPAKITHSTSRGASTGLLTVAVFVVGFFLIGLNYWHAMRCVPAEAAVSSDATDIHIASLERRLLASEAENIKVALVLKKVLQVIQHKYVELSTLELERINKEAEEESVKIALGIAAQPPPSMPEFSLDPSLQDPQALSAFVDDFFGTQQRQDAEKEMGGFGGQDGLGGGEWKGWEDKEGGFDDIFQLDKSPEEQQADLLSEEEKNAACNTMKNDYSVVIGVSWGNLPYDLQDKWAVYKCDMYFTGSSSV